MGRLKVNFEKMAVLCSSGLFDIPFIIHYDSTLDVNITIGLNISHWVRSSYDKYIYIKYKILYYEVRVGI